jgi:hypothetical protein
MMTFLFIGGEFKKLNHAQKKLDQRISIENVSLAGPDCPFYGRLPQQPPYGQVLFQAEGLSVSPENLTHVIAFRLLDRVLLGSDRGIE